MRALNFRRMRALNFRFFPTPRLRRAEDRFNHGHVHQGVFERDGLRRALAHGAREEVALNRILVARRELKHLDAGAEDVRTIIDEYPRRAIIRRVEGNLDLDASARAEELRALVGDHLRGASE